jgi:hypothetical protein
MVWYQVPAISPVGLYREDESNAYLRNVGKYLPQAMNHNNNLSKTLIAIFS